MLGPIKSKNIKVNYSGRIKIALLNFFFFGKLFWGPVFKRACQKCEALLAIKNGDDCKEGAAGSATGSNHTLVVCSAE